MRDYYLPDAEELEPPDAEEGGAGLSGASVSGDDSVEDTSQDETHDTGTSYESLASLEGLPVGTSKAAREKGKGKHGKASAEGGYRENMMRNIGKMSPMMGGAQWKLREKHFFAISIPGGPMEVFAATTAEDATEWVQLLRRECSVMPER